MNIRTAVMLALIAAAGAGENLDWPQWRGPAATGFAAPGTYNLDWKSKAPKELWRVKTGPEGVSGLSAAGGVLCFLDQEGAKGVLRALDLATGKELWRQAFDDADKANYGYQRATPAFAGGQVFALGRKGQMLAFSAKEGKPGWSLNLLKDLGGKGGTWEITASPVIDGDRLLVMVGGKGGVVAALEQATGKVVWRGGPGDDASYAPPVLTGSGASRQILAFSAKQLSALEAATGKTLWSFPWETSHDVNAATPIPLGDQVFITSGYKHGSALVQAGKQVWAKKDMQSHFSSPILHEGCIYGTSDPGQVMCVEAATGTVKWSQKGFGKGGVVGLPDGCFVVEDSANGAVSLARLDPAAWKELGRLTPFTDKVKAKVGYWSPPIVADRKLLVRGLAEIVCYDLTP